MFSYAFTPNIFRLDNDPLPTHLNWHTYKLRRAILRTCLEQQDTYKSPGISALFVATKADIFKLNLADYLVYRRRLTI